MTKWWHFSMKISSNPKLENAIFTCYIQERTKGKFILKFLNVICTPFFFVSIIYVLISLAELFYKYNFFSSPMCRCFPFGYGLVKLTGSQIPPFPWNNFSHGYFLFLRLSLRRCFRSRKMAMVPKASCKVASTLHFVPTWFLA